MQSSIVADRQNEPNMSKDFIISEDWIADESFHYRQKITIDGGAVATEANYQMRIPVTYNAHMQTDFDDIRFVNTTETEELNYWLEEKIDSTWALFWVEIDQNITTTNQTLAYIYYSNTGASSTSNGELTFEFFDDFDSSS